MPVYSIPPPGRFGSENGRTMKDDKGIEREETMRITNNTPEAREKALDPTNEMIVTTSNMADAYKNTHHFPYSVNLSQVTIYFW